MSIAGYREAVRRTMAPSNERQILILTLGVVGELQEALDAVGPQEDEELGDLLWYLTALDLALHDCCNAPLYLWGATRDPEYFTDDLIRCRRTAAYLAENVKKLIGHHKLVLEAVLGHLADMHRPFEALEPERLTAIMNANVAKLQARYPEGFKCE